MNAYINMHLDDMIDDETIIIRDLLNLDFYAEFDPLFNYLFKMVRKQYNEDKVTTTSLTHDQRAYRAFAFAQHSFARHLSETINVNLYDKGKLNVFKFCKSVLKSDDTYKDPEKELIAYAAQFIDLINLFTLKYRNDRKLRKLLTNITTEINPVLFNIISEHVDNVSAGLAAIDIIFMFALTHIQLYNSDIISAKLTHTELQSFVRDFCMCSHPWWLSNELDIAKIYHEDTRFFRLKYHIRNLFK